jgi:uncharacterized repeat protein (TIGR01451 family)
MKIQNIIFFLFIPFFSFSQVFTFAHSETGPATSSIYQPVEKDVIRDKLGNIIVANGWFSLYDSKIEVIKYSSDGTVIWKQTFNDGKFVFGLNVDEIGDIYMVSEKYNSINLYQPLRFNISTANCLTKLSKNGDIKWIKPIGDMVRPANNNVTGRNFLKKNKKDFYFTASTKTKAFQFLDTTIQSPNNRDTALIIVKFDTSGKLKWFNHIITGGNIWPTGIDINDNGKMVIGGHFYGGAACGTSTLTDNDYTAMFYGMFDTDSGSCYWLHKIKGFMQYGSKLIDVVITRNNVVKALVNFSSNIAGFLKFADTTIYANNAIGRAFIANTFQNGDEASLKNIYLDNTTMLPYCLENDQYDNLYTVGINMSGAVPTHLEVEKVDSSCSSIKWIKNINTYGGTNFGDSKIYQLYSSTDGLSLTGNVVTSSTGLKFGLDSLLSYQGKVSFTSFLKDSAASIQGHVYVEFFNDSLFDSTDPLITFALVKASNITSTKYGLTDYAGKYRLVLDSGSTTIEPLLNNPYFTVSPASYKLNLSASSELQNLNFEYQPKKLGIIDISVNVICISPAKPGLPIQYVLTYKNKGTRALYCNYALKFDSSLHFISTSGRNTSTLKDSIYSYPSFIDLFQTKTVTLTFKLDSNAIVGSKLKTIAYLYPIATDSLKTDNIDSTITTITNALDPNVKSVDKSIMDISQVHSGNEWLEYVVRFQNTGTDTAYTVRLMDTLSTKLNIDSFQFISSSHNVNINLDKNIAIFRFDNIMLPDSNRNQLASHGFVNFRIKPFNNLNTTDTIHNNSSIYFDYNLPVVTNTTSSFFQSYIILPVNRIEFSATEKSKNVNLVWKVFGDYATIDVEKSVDQIHWVTIYHLNAESPTDKEYNRTDDHPYSGVSYYRIKLNKNNGPEELSSIRSINIRTYEPAPFTVLNNPVINKELEIKIMKPLDLFVFDSNGKLLIEKKENAGTIDRIDLNRFAKGTYVLSGCNFNQKVILQ